MKNTERDWLRDIPWETVLSINQTFCETQQTPHQPREKGLEKARQLWEQSAAGRLALPDALDVCRRCYELSPFIFNNGNTFAAAAKKMLENWFQLLPPVEAQIARTTVGHYVVGQIDRKELLQVLSHFESKWKLNAETPVAGLQTAAFRSMQPQREAAAS